MFRMNGMVTTRETSGQIQPGWNPERDLPIFATYEEARAASLDFMDSLAKEFNGGKSFRPYKPIFDDDSNRIGQWYINDAGTIKISTRDGAGTHLTDRELTSGITNSVDIRVSSSGIKIPAEIEGSHHFATSQEFKKSTRAVNEILAQQALSGGRRRRRRNG